MGEEEDKKDKKVIRFLKKEGGSDDVREKLKAVDWGYLRDNPCKGVKELGEPPGRIRYLDPNEELDKLLEACDAISVMGNTYNTGRKLSQLLKV